MAEAAKGMFIPYHWIDEIAINDEEKIDENYSREVAWELLKALKAYGKGEEIKWPEDRYIKAIVRGYVQQEQQMQKNIHSFTNNKKGRLSDKEIDDLIYKLAYQGKDAPVIYKILTENYECTYKNYDFIYRREGWKKWKRDEIQLKNKIQLKTSDQLNSVDSAENKDFPAENQENSVKYVF